MKNAIIYLTRKCVRSCAYCGIKDNHFSNELNIVDWKRVFEILDALGVDFKLILGNEPWIYGKDLVSLFGNSKIPYALYTSASKKLFDDNYEYLFGNGITNFSVGVDTLGNLDFDDDSVIKALDAFYGFKILNEKFPNVEKHATITIHKKNYFQLPKLVNYLTAQKVFINFNLIHWNKDGGFDFFAKKENMKDLLFEKSDYSLLRSVFDTILEGDISYIQNPEYFKNPIEKLVSMGWHCKGNPYGGPTIDADGSLRVCGYRKGKYTPKFSIFDLPDKEKEWQEAVKKDAKECSGCSWSCPMMYSYWKENDVIKGTDIFGTHGQRLK